MNRASLLLLILGLSLLSTLLHYVLSRRRMPARLLLLILYLSSLSGSVNMHPATLRVVEMPDAKPHQIPLHYYDYAPIGPTGMDAYEWLENLEWADEYKESTWDCSKMAAYLEWALENAGVPAKIRVGWQHAWLLVWRADKGEWWAFEAIELQWIPPWAEGRYYSLEAEAEWDDIYATRKWFGHYPYIFANEFAWWADSEIRLERD